MPKFRVTKCVDAYVNYEAIIEAKNEEEARILAKDNDGDHAWEQTGFSEYASVDYDNIPPEEVSDEELAAEAAVDTPKDYALTGAERDTVLAALRYWQQAIERQDLPPMLVDIATNGASHECLNSEEIDALCERINS